MTRRGKLLNTGGCNTRSGKSTGGAPTETKEVNKMHQLIHGGKSRIKYPAGIV